MRWFLWLRIASLRTGILTGIYLSCVFVAWLDRRQSRSPHWSLLPNCATSLAGAILIMVLGDSRAALPAAVPEDLFVAGLTAWTLLTLTYLAAEMHFTLLESRMGAFHVFMLGAVSYGFVAVLDWVFLMCAGVRHEHIVQSRETMASAGKHHTH